MELAESRHVDRVQTRDQTSSVSHQRVYADPLLKVVRLSVWVAFVLAIANGVFLYFFPGLAESSYAWAIKPPVNAAFMGAGYLSGVLATGLALFAARYWRSVWGLMWPFFTIGLVELLATFLHTNRFRWDYWLTWVWVAVYMIIPPAVVVLWIIQQRASHMRPSVDAELSPMRAVSGLLGAVVAAFGLWLFIAPETFVTSWPWQLTPLLARAFSAWYLQMGVTLLFSALTLRQAHEALVPYSWLAAINALLLLLPVLYSAAMRTGSTSFWAWLALHLALLTAGAWGALQSYRLMRQTHKRI